MKSATSRSIFSAQKETPQTGVFAIASSPSEPVEESAQPSSRLVARDETGQIAHSWKLNQSKITIGSSEDCSIHFDQPGIQPIHCLIIPGSRQLFVRALAADVTQDGVPFNEILLNARRNSFEIAGHRFEFLPGKKPESSHQKPSERLRFATVRPVEASTRALSGAISRKAAAQEIQIADTPWLNRLIQKTIEPLESQIESLLLPVAEFQARVVESEQSRKAEAAEDQLRREAMANEISEIVSRQSATVESLSQRLGDVNQQLIAIEQIIAEENSAVSSVAENVENVTQEIHIHRSAVEQLQAGMIAVTDSLKQLQQRQESAQSEGQQWRVEIQEQLMELSEIVADIKERTSGSNVAEVLDAVQSLQHHQNVAQEEVRNWQYRLQEHLDTLELRLGESKNSAAPFVAASQPSADPGSIADPRNGLQLSTPDSGDHQIANDQFASESWERAFQSSRGQPFQQSPEHDPEVSSEDYPEPVFEAFSEKVSESVTEPESEGDSPFQTRNPFSEQPFDSIGEATIEERVLLGDDWLDQWSLPAASEGNHDLPNNSPSFPSDASADSSLTGNDPIDSLTVSPEPLRLPTVEPSADTNQMLATPTIRPVAPEEVALEAEEEFFFGEGPLGTDRNSGHDREAELKTELISPTYAENLLDRQQPSDSRPNDDQLPSWWTEDTVDDESEEFSKLRSEVVRDERPDTDIEEAAVIADEPASIDDVLPETESDHYRQPTNHEDDQEKSVESYMQDLLARMRGDSAYLFNSAVDVNGSLSNSSGNVASVSGQSDPESPSSLMTTDPIDWESYQSLTKAPEKDKNIDLLRDLANSSARTAIQHSVRRRHLSGSLLKMMVCIVGLTVAGVLLAINGLEVNIGLVATFASLLVAIIWGYDSFVSLKPLLQRGLVLEPPIAESTELNEKE